MKIRKNSMTKIIIVIIVLILLVLLLFSEKIFNLNKNNIKLAENTEENEMLQMANLPVISAGMIPVKFNGMNWVLTSKEDKEWYDYANGKPAYIMLNDGTYQSELLPNMTDKKLAKEHIGVNLEQPEDFGSIYVWIPRFAYKSNNIMYTRNVEECEINWTISDLFKYIQSSTKPDFLLEGVWVEKDTLGSTTDVTNKLNDMKGESNKYGFIANTIGVDASAESTYITTMQKYINNAIQGTENNDCQIQNPENTKRTILKIINQNYETPIKATGIYDKNTGLITVQVTYSKYGISQITDETILTGNKKLTITSEDGNRVTATSRDISIEDGENIISIIDNNGNKLELKVNVYMAVYATLYKNTTNASKYDLVFSKAENPIGGTIVKAFGDISGIEYNSGTGTLWYGYRNNIVKVNFADKVAPISTQGWFLNCKYLEEIINIDNLNTKNVTNMSAMFSECNALTSIDVSNFDTKNVTDMSKMFSGCRNLTQVDVSKFDTSNVTNMNNMFNYCSVLTDIDVSDFDTSNVIDMGDMFFACKALTSIDVSKFNTNNVTNMSYMFYGCSGLTNIDVSKFNTSNVTNMSAMFGGCSGLTNIDVSKFNTNNVTNMSSMFSECSGLTNIDVAKFNTNNVNDISSIFSGCSGLTNIDVTNFNTSNVTNMSGMFSRCSGLTNIDVTNFDTSNVTNMRSMFYNCWDLKSLNLIQVM